jgi:hypothetical protein
MQLKQTRFALQHHIMPHDILCPSSSLVDVSNSHSTPARTKRRFRICYSFELLPERTRHHYCQDDITSCHRDTFNLTAFPIHCISDGTPACVTVRSGGLLSFNNWLVPTCLSICLPARTTRCPSCRTCRGLHGTYLQPHFRSCRFELTESLTVYRPPYVLSILSVRFPLKSMFYIHL